MTEVVTIDPADITPRRRSEAEIDAELIRIVRRLAASLDHDLAARFERIERSLTPPRPGPGRAKRAKLAARNDALRRLRRRHYDDLSARGAAEMMAKDAGHYVTCKAYARDREKGFAPEMEPRRTFYCLLVEHDSMPGVESIKKILLEG